MKLFNCSAIVDFVDLEIVICAKDIEEVKDVCSIYFLDEFKYKYGLTAVNIKNVIIEEIGIDCEIPSDWMHEQPYGDINYIDFRTCYNLERDFELEKLMPNIIGKKIISYRIYNGSVILTLDDNSEIYMSL